jgi:hypothetical protein
LLLATERRGHRQIAAVKLTLQVQGAAGKPAKTKIVVK